MSRCGAVNGEQFSFGGLPRLLRAPTCAPGYAAGLYSPSPAPRPSCSCHLHVRWCQHGISTSRLQFLQLSHFIPASNQVSLMEGGEPKPFIPYRRSPTRLIIYTVGSGLGLVVSTNDRSLTVPNGTSEQTNPPLIPGWKIKKQREAGRLDKLHICPSGLLSRPLESRP